MIIIPPPSLQGATLSISSPVKQQTVVAYLPSFEEDIFLQP